MPGLRGIEVSLTTEPDDENIPEYPHPEGASAQILGSPPNSPDSQGSHRKSGPTVSVYIPSVPATPFSINYTINHAPPAPCKYIFFRLYMNARPIAAWGVDPKFKPKGKVVRTLWAPSALYHHRVGFEGRNFVFLSGPAAQTVAEDGGLIEIRVFRAKERRARAPRLDEFRFRENYGIAAPSIGLLDRPQDASFYDWHLLDAKDSPFASFRLHYRSLKNLQQLNLIPANELELMCAASPRALRSIARADIVLRRRIGGIDSLLRESKDVDEDVFDACTEASKNGEGGAEILANFIKSPPELFRFAQSNSRVPQPSKQYLDEGSFDPEETEFGIARLVRLYPVAPTLRNASVEDCGSGTAADDSDSDYEASPKSTDDSPLAKKLPPSRYLPTTGSSLERGMALFGSPKLSASAKNSTSRRSLPSIFSPERQAMRTRRMTNPIEKQYAPAVYCMFITITNTTAANMTIVVRIIITRTGKRRILNAI
ncbi:hypothetical protein N0V88_001274 [Collariella sp. IMI 366227]|nr:hypothetical protein N0V88_001274 [Collariella sp. IMI 366227]